MLGASLAILLAALNPQSPNAAQSPPPDPDGFPLPRLTVRDGQPPMYKLTYVVHAYANWSPDDRQIVFQSNAAGNWDLYVTGVDGQGLHPIVTNPAADITPTFSPDGRQIAFVSERDGNREVYVCNADGTAQRRLTNDPAPDIHPAWSADGRRLIFSSSRGNRDPEDFDIYSMNPDGTDVKQITRGPTIDTYASWSPDGRRIVTRRVVNGNNEVFVMDADGGNARNLTNDPKSYDGWPVWSPDGKRIAFAAGPDGQSPHRVCIMNADGSGRSALTDAPPGTDWVYDTQPAFAHNGKLLAFTRYRLGAMESSEICILKLPPTT